MKFQTIIKDVSDMFHISPYLSAAFIKAESSFDPKATRFEAHYKWLSNVEEHAKRLGISEEEEKKNQMTSWGLMQIMGANARELGFQDCLQHLLEPELNLLYCLKFLQNLFHKHHAIELVISSYNQGSPKKDLQGKFLNQSYVDKVLKYMEEFQKQKVFG